MRRTMGIGVSLVCALALAACDSSSGGGATTDGNGGNTDTGGGGGDTGGGGGDTAGGGEVPSESAALFAYLQGADYKTFEAEAAVHASPTHGQVRVYVNSLLAGSLAAGDATHPAGSAAIKELYEDDLTTLKGWAVSVKTQADSDGGNGWYWYEITSTTDGSAPAVDGTGVSACTGCHAAGKDFFQTAYPLQ